MKRTLLFLLCLLAALLLTACHVDNDPWPVNVELPTAVPAATAVPVETATPEPIVTGVPGPGLPTPLPAVTQTPTEVPGGSEAPGING